MNIAIRTKRIDSNTTAIIRDGRVAGWVHTGPDHTWVGQLALGSNPARNQRIFNDMNDAVQWVWAGQPNLTRTYS